MRIIVDYNDSDSGFKQLKMAGCISGSKLLLFSFGEPFGVHKIARTSIYSIPLELGFPIIRIRGISFSAKGIIPAIPLAWMRNPVRDFYWFWQFCNAKAA
jgi:hypothetical protein